MQQKKFFNDSFAIWILGNKNRSDVHINEWLIPADENYIDFGIRIYEVNQVDVLGLFVPYILMENEIEDLWDKMCNEKIARGVLNALCSISQNSNSGIIDIEYKNKKENIIKLSLLNIKIENIDAGTIILFDFSEVKSKINRDEVYIRFRIPHKSLPRLIDVEEPDFESFFESPVIKYQYNCVFKLNEVRELPWEVRNISNISNQNIDKVVITISVSGKYDIDDNKCYKVRQLEGELYQDYVPKNFDCNNVISYSWRDELRKHYNFNFKISREFISKNGLLKYAVIVIVLSAIGSALWSGIVKIYDILEMFILYLQT